MLSLLGLQCPATHAHNTDVVYSTGDPWGTSHELHCSMKGWPMQMCECVYMLACIDDDNNNIGSYIVPEST